MRILHRIQHAVAAGFVSAALVTSAAAQVIPVKPEDGSKHFAAVAKHLELGGLFFTYMDVDGDFASLGELGDRLIGIARKSTPAIPKDLIQYNYYLQSGIPLVKRAEVLGVGRTTRRRPALLVRREGSFRLASAVREGS